MESFFELLEARDCARCLFLSDRPSGLCALAVLDDLTLGPAVGGTRTRAYASLASAFEDAAALTAADVEVWVTDIDTARAELLAAELGARVGPDSRQARPARAQGVSVAERR